MRPRIINVDQIPPEGETLDLPMSASEVAELLHPSILPDAVTPSSLTARVRVLPSGDDVFVLGSLSGSVRCECSRCLEGFDQGIAGEFHVTFVREMPCAAGGETELHREDLDLELLRRERIDLAEVLAEQVLLQLPSHPLCRDTCRGLCPVCGGNRNLVACGCGDPAGEPRFAVLASLRRDEGDVDV